jgi:hypothetical protein
MPAASHQRLRGGRISDLHAVYGGLGSGRLVIIGAPGAGKSGAAVLLVLAALKHRGQVSAEDRQRIPIPVMFTMHGWDPRQQRVHDWLVVRLQQTYPLFAGKFGGRKAAAVLAAGKISVILDGLDEIPRDMRLVALRALNQQADFRLVVLTRSAEMTDAAVYGSLDDAAALELEAIDASTAASYLDRVQLHPAPQPWRELCGRLRGAPDSPLARALGNPLTLTLVRDTYRSGDDIQQFLDFCGTADRNVTSEQIVDHLLDKVLLSAYSRRPGESPLQYDLPMATRTLGCLAARMNQDGTRDLLWWRIRSWAPSAPRVAVSGLLVGLVTGIGAGLGVTPLAGVAGGAAAAITYGLLFAFRDASPSEMGPRPLRQVFNAPSILYGIAAAGVPSGLTVGLPVGVAAGVPVGAAAGLAFGLAVGVALGTFGFLSERNIDSLATVASLTPVVSWRNGRAVGVAAGLIVGLTAGLSLGLAGGLDGGPAVGIAIGLAVGLGVWRCAGLIVGLPAGLVIGAAVGIADGVVVDLAVGQALGVAKGLGLGLLGGAALGLAGGLMYARTWPATLVFVQLAIRWRTPIRLMRFLEDARARNVLRTVGPVYQFRHARLQDRLAEQAPIRKRPAGSPRVSPTAGPENAVLNATSGLPAGKQTRP